MMEFNPRIYPERTGFNVNSVGGRILIRASKLRASSLFSDEALSFVCEIFIFSNEALILNFEDQSFTFKAFF